MKQKLQLLFEKIFGYYFHKVAYLPMGTSLRVDILKKFNYSSVNIVFDVGANVGQTYNRFRKDFIKATIFCFEPVKKTFDDLKKNLSKEKNAIVENIAFGEAIGEKEIKLFEDWTVFNSLNDHLMNNSDNAKVEIVKIDTIDHYCKRENINKIDLLKIDTEGYEMNVLKGAIELLEQNKISFILCEVGFSNKNLRNTNFSILSDFLGDYGYYFVSMHNGGNENWKTGGYYGDALFASSKLKFE